jgi:hypothetical protein
LGFSASATATASSKSRITASATPAVTFSVLRSLSPGANSQDRALMLALSPGFVMAPSILAGVSLLPLRANCPMCTILPVPNPKVQRIGSHRPDRLARRKSEPICTSKKVLRLDSTPVAPSCSGAAVAELKMVRMNEI